MFSLCIPTMNRFDDYLKKYLVDYLQNELIDEIIISDENGNDIKKIIEYFGKNEKFKFNTNQTRQGPFINKIICCKMAKNNWIALIDSDNFADKDYFIKMKNFIESNSLSKYTILSPDYASRVFQWKSLTKSGNNLFNKYTYRKIEEFILNNNIKNENIKHLLNIGNYVINKSIINDFHYDPQDVIVKKSNSYDVLLFLLICFKELNIDLYLVKDCHYVHELSKNSVYLECANEGRCYANKCYEEIFKLLKN